MEKFTPEALVRLNGKSPEGLSPATMSIIQRIVDGVGANPVPDCYYTEALTEELTPRTEEEQRAFCNDLGWCDFDRIPDPKGHDHQRPLSPREAAGALIYEMVGVAQLEMPRP